MIFVGDIAHPFQTTPDWGGMAFPWGEAPIIANLEGVILDSNPSIHLKDRRLFNHQSIMPALAQSKVCAVTLANNHIMDFPQAFRHTYGFLNDVGIAALGAGANLAEASMPVRLINNECTILLLAYGWETIQCQSATASHPGVNPLQPQRILDDVTYWRHKEPTAAMVVLMHWNYEMELYPQPAHRQLAMAIIDAGAEAVIGHHPHRVGGIEFHNGKMIAYSVGNWWLPQKSFFGGKLCFTEDACLQLGLEWMPNAEPICHWFRYKPETHDLCYIKSENVCCSEQIRNRTPYAYMGLEQYKTWFANNRIKRKLLPIYSDYRSSKLNLIKDNYVWWRHSGILLLERYGFRRIFGF